MMFNVKKALALAAAVMTVTALGAGCSGKKTGDQQSSSAKVSIDASNAISAIDHISLTIEAGTGSAMTDITTTLTKGSSGSVWTGYISNIPATDATHTRLFKAAAYSAANVEIYEGETSAAVLAGNTAQVTIILQELNATPGPENYAPVITALTYTDAYVLPSTVLNFSVTAKDPDHTNGTGGTPRTAYDGTPLAYSWAATCTAGQFSFGTASYNAATFTDTTTFTAPAVNSVCTVAITVTETGISNPLSVTTYFAVTVNADFGNAIVNAFPNSFPIVTVRGNFRYNSSSTVTTIPVGQQADLHFSAIDPDGDNVRYNVQAQCASSLSAAATAGPVDAKYFDITSAGPEASGTAFEPHFGYTKPAETYTNYDDDCIFTVTVHDVCTSGNCGTTSGLANGADKVSTVNGVQVTSLTVGKINATHAAHAASAPHIVRVVAPNQDGAAVGSVQTWDPQKAALVVPGSTYNLQIEAQDQDGTSALTSAWNTTLGTLGTAATTTTAGVTKSTDTWTAPAALTAGMQVTATVTSAVTGLSTVVTFNLAGSDPCVVNGWATGHACTTGNACVTGETCSQSGVCEGGSAVTCPVVDSQCQAPICDKVNGCSFTNVADGTACNADSNGCTQGDSCHSGTCVAGTSTPSCSTPSSACYAAAGTCSSTGNTTYQCSYPALAAGAACSPTGSYDHCYLSYSCDGAGACNVPADPITCSSTTCRSGGTCNSTTGFCDGANNAASTVACDDGNGCTTGDHCDGAGSCASGGALCQAGQSCNASGPTCTASSLVPKFERDLQIAPPAGLAMDSAGGTYVVGSIYSDSPISFDGHSVVSNGDSDLFVARYDSATGLASWAFGFGDAANGQIGSGAAVTNNGKLAVLGNFTGTLKLGSAASAPSITSASLVDFLGLLDASTGTGTWAKAFNDGENGSLAAVAANPGDGTATHGNRIAVCGFADAAATDLVPGATASGQLDIIIAMYDATVSGAPTLLWSKQVGTASNEECDSLAVDDNGDVIAAGKFDGASLSFGGSTATLTGPGSGLRKFMWVAKFDGATGAATAAAAFSGTGNVTPKALAVDASGNAFVGGNFTGSPTLGSTTLASAGSSDAFVAKLTQSGATFVTAANWVPVRLGGTAADTVNSLAVTSYGDVVATGSFLRTTTGVATLTATGTTAADVFVLKLNGARNVDASNALLAPDFAAAYGSAATQSGDAIVVNRFGANQLATAGTLNGSITFSPLGQLSPVGATDAYLMFAQLQ